MEDVAYISNITAIFTLILALSLLIERLLEIFKSIFYLLDSRLNWYKYWTRRTHKLRYRVEKKLKIFEYVEPTFVANILYRFRSILLEEQKDYAGTVPVLSGDLVRAFYLKIILKIIGMLVGIAFTFSQQINLFEIALNKQVTNTMWVDNAGIVISGILIGLGTGPVHKAITSIEKRRERQKAKQKGGQT